MARPDPLDSATSLNYTRFGHCPALWLAIPLLIGCAADAGWNLSAGPCLALGMVGVLFAWLSNRHPQIAACSLVITGIFFGAAWHHLRTPPQERIIPRRSFGEFPILIEHASPRKTGEGWTGLGVITDRDGGLFRRRVALSVHGVAPADGAELMIAGHIEALPLNPQGFDAWVASQGATLRLGGGRNLGELAPPTRFSTWCQEQETRLEYWLRRLPWKDDEGGALLAATMLGRTSLLPAEAKSAFMITGTLHLFAISGLHIAGMTAALLWIAKRLRLPAIPAGIAILATLWIYVEITGASPSSVRAWIMAAFIWGGQVGERSTPALQSLALACAATLIISPAACTDAGFQLSYIAVLGLITAGGPAARLCTQPTEEERLTPKASRTAAQRTRWWLRKFLLSGLCISLAATLAGTPLTLGLFGSASWGGLFVNLVLVPLSEIPLVLGMASTACSVSDWLLWPGLWLNGAAAACLHAMTWCAEVCALVPSMNMHLTLTQPWLGPAGGILMSGVFLMQAEAQSVRRLLGGPALALLLWLAFAWLLQ